MPRNGGTAVATRGRREEPIDPSYGAVAQFAEELRSLRKRSELTIRELARRAHCSVGTVSEAQAGRALPSWGITRALVIACGEDPADWHRGWTAAAAVDTPGLPVVPVPVAADGRAAGIQDAPVIESIASPEEFHSSLRALRAQRGNPSLRELCADAGQAGHVLARSTLADALRRTERLPSMEIVEGLLAAYQVPVCERDRWRWAWSRAAYLRQQVSDPPSARWAGQCPWPGLAAYDEDTADVFYGREQLITRLAARLAAMPGGAGMMAVLGASGSGKSSLLRAGLVPAIAAGRVSRESGEWPCLIMTPGHAPMEELAARLAEVKSRRLVLVIDQFEELFTGPSDEFERAVFIDALVSLAHPVDSGQADLSAVVVLGLRSDFFHLCAGYQALSAVLEHPFLVDPMTDAELRVAIAGPAGVAGLAVEPALVDLIVRDLQSSRKDGAILPFLSHALRQAWEHREDGVLTCRSYDRAGGLARGIRDSAERAYERLGPARQATARKLLIRMVGVNRDGVTARRRVQLADVDVFDAGQEILREFAAARLVMIDRDTAEITHEAVLRGWPRLAGWIDEERARIRAYWSADEAAHAWQEAGRDRAFLYRGSRLITLREVLREPADLPPVVRDFLAASRRTARYWRIAGKAMIATMALLSCATTVTAVLAVQQRNQAQVNSRLAASREIAIQSQSVSDPMLAAELAATAFRLDPVGAASAEISVAVATASAQLITASKPVSGITFSQGGGDLNVYTTDGHVEQWNIAGTKGPQHIRTTSVGRQWEALWLVTPDASSETLRMYLSYLSSGSSDVYVWNLDGDLKKELTEVPVVNVSPQGTPSTSPVAIAFSPDGTAIAPSPARNSVAYSPGGRMTAIGVNGYGIKILGKGGAAIAEVPLGHSVNYLSFSPDGKQLVAASGNTVYIWNLADLTAPQTLLRDLCAQGHQLTPRQWNQYIPALPYQNVCAP